MLLSCPQHLQRTCEMVWPWNKSSMSVRVPGNAHEWLAGMRSPIILTEHIVLRSAGSSLTSPDGSEALARVALHGIQQRVKELVAVLLSPPLERL